MGLSLTDGQIHAMEVTERVTSFFSLTGILFILGTFLLAPGFDKPINRLIFLASWSNLGMNIATLIAEAGPRAGANSSLCQFQAWAIQMFLGVDVFWALCMSLNVYLALFRKWTAQRMRAQELKYFIGCYGASLIPAVVYLFIDSKERGKVYGPALLWCWITTEWDFLRLATLYAVVWVAIFFAFCIYCLAFAKVWRNRHELTGLFNPFNEDPFAGVITTEIEIVRHSVQGPAGEQPKSFDFDSAAEYNGIRRGSNTTNDMEHGTLDPYSVNVEVGERETADRGPSVPEAFKVRTLTRNAALSETNPDAWLYARVAFLFFCALLIAWVPSSINRLYSLIYPDRLIYGLNYVETLVLPLQGFWNCCVYVITSQTAVRNLFRMMVGKAPLPRRNTYMDRSGLNMPTTENSNVKKAIDAGVQKFKAGMGRSPQTATSDLSRGVFNQRTFHHGAHVGGIPYDATSRERAGSDYSSEADLTAKPYPPPAGYSPAYMR